MTTPIQSTNATLESAESPSLRKTPVLKVVGVGGAGLQAVAHMAESGLAGLAFAGVHTDARMLGQSGLTQKLLLGGALTRGLGAGGDPDIGRAAAEAETEKLAALCGDADLLIIVAGLGGGTGSGAAPILARAAREKGALVLALVTLPFDFERRRREQARLALRQLKTAADAVICLSNQKVAGLIDEKTTLHDAFIITNEMLASGVRGIWRLVTRQGLINVDFADLCRVVRGRHTESCFATAEAAGENRVREVADQLLASPLLESGRLLAEAEAVLVSIAGGTDLTLKEVSQIMEQINRLCDNAQVIMGAVVDPAFNDRLAVTLVAAKRGEPETEPEEGTGLVRPEPQPPAAEFPVSPNPSESEATTGILSERHPSRFAAPPPELTREQAVTLLGQSGRRTSRHRKKTAGMRQELLPLDVISKGRFEKSEPTIHRGEDLDTPTYIRRGVALN